MNRKVLLVEPNYKNKYPPMGLMKIATYYRLQGDDVTFFKGDLRKLVLENTYNSLLKQLYANDDSIFWEVYKPQIIEYISKGRAAAIEDVPLIDSNPIIRELFKYYRKYYFNKDYFKPENRIYDRVGITTLFTFYWDITIDTINFAKQLCKTKDGVMVGGVMASILPDKVKEATGIMPFVGTLSNPGILDDNDIIIDTLPLDYSILEEIDYEYPVHDGYFAYMTRGCVNHCAFCAVPKLEPHFQSILHISEQVRITEERFGAKRDLLLLDNNVLASKCFNQIIDEIKASGFYRGCTYTPPNRFEIIIRNLRDGYNDRGYLRAVVKEYKKLIKRFGSSIQDIYDLLERKHLLEEYTAKKDAVFETYDQVKPYFEKIYTGKAKKRIVDFNQGIDSRLITDENMQKLYEIPIKPVRIAFDHWELHDIYENAVRAAARHGHDHLSNYVLYNFKDKPEELYYRLDLNIKLCDELDINIYSFPMKYHPIEDPDYFSNRDYIGIHWNRKFIRAIQTILNATKGKVARGHDFFYKAFGNNVDEYKKILYMPEEFILFRFKYEENGLTEEWWKTFSSLSNDKLAIAKGIIESNDFKDIENRTEDPDILRVLRFYKIRA